MPKLGLFKPSSYIYALVNVTDVPIQLSREFMIIKLPIFAWRDPLSGYGIH